MSSQTRGWARRASAAVALVAVYLVVWTPARAPLASRVAGPAVAAVAQGSYGTDVVATPKSVVITRDGSPVDSWRAPAGVAFALGAIAMLLGGAGVRPVLALWGVHLALGALALAVAAAGAAGLTVGFAAHRWLRVYVEPAVAVGLPLVVLLLRSQRGARVG